MNTLDYILQKYNINKNYKKFPIEIPNTNRVNLAQLFAELEFREGAEIGVERGLYSEVLCRENPGLALHCVDAWTAYRGYRDHVTQKALNEIYEDAKRRLTPYGCKLVKGFSVDVAKQFKDESLDFVYIDANHELQNVINDICEWQKKVRVGGIVAGHDFIRRKGSEYIMHVPYAVMAYTGAYLIKPWFVLGTKDGKDKGEIRDTPRSWFFVKPEPPKIKPGHDGD